MKPEIEAKFSHIDHDALRAQLHELGAVLVQPNRLMKRRNYDFPGKTLEKTRRGWVRLRDEGDKITLSYKQLNERSLTGMHEACVAVDDFAATDAFLQAIGLESEVYQESKRESWRLGEAEIELDEWPWLQPFLEIEGPTEETVRQAAERLGLDWSRALHGSVEVLYRTEYNVTDEEVYAWPEITFCGVPEWLAEKRRDA